MAISASGTRVSNTLMTQLAMRNINSNMRSLLDLQYQLSSGLRLYKTSIDPGGAAVAMAFQNLIERRDQATTNIDRSNEYLASTDNALSDLQDLLNQAIDVASTNIGSASDDTARQNAATVIGSLITQLAQLGNRQYQGRYLFAGQATDTAPFDLSSTQVRFVGDCETLTTIIDRSDSVQYNITAEQAFGTLTGRVTSVADLNPALTLATRLSELNGGLGVRLGTIAISDGVTSTQVDLSRCNTVSDVVSAINSNGVVSVTAAISADGSGLTLAADPGDTISVTDLPGGFTASDLGILQRLPLAAGTDLVGADLDRLLTQTTELSALKGGAGLDQVNGLILSIGDQSRTIDLSGAVTMEDLLNTINYCGLDVKARVSTDGRRIEIANAVASEQMRIGENGGSTAEDLGVRSMYAGSLLSTFNEGLGVRIIEGVADFTIYRHDGVAMDIDLTGCSTLQNVLDKINSHPDAAGNLVASLNDTGNGIVLTDLTAGAGDLRVVRANSSFAATDLGIEQTVANPGATLEGEDVNPVIEQGVFYHLFALRDALLSNDSAGVTKAGAALRDEINRVARVRGVAGVRMQSLALSKTRVENERLQVQDLLSEVRDLDYASAVSKFQTLQTTFQASLQTASNVLPLSLLDFLRQGRLGKTVR